MDTQILTRVLKRFTIYLQELPANLRLMCHSLLFFLIALEIALTIYQNIDNPQFNLLSWGKHKILKIGFIMFAINKYEWLMAGIKSFFFYAVEKAIRVSFLSNEYFENPSLLYQQGCDLANTIYEESVSFWHISSWPLAILAFLILVGFLIITIQVIICWVEFYFLTGFSIIFLPFGALDITGEYYKNVFKTIMSCSIKLGVMNFWLILSTAIIKDLVKLTSKNMRLDNVALIFGTLYVLVAVMQFMPSLASSLLTGSPALNAGAAMSGAIAAGTGLVTAGYNTLRTGTEGAKGFLKGGMKGAEYGGKGGSLLGGAIGGGAGATIGKVVGGAAGAVLGAGVGGSYAASRYALKHGIMKKPEYNNKNEKGGSHSFHKSKNDGGNPSSATSNSTVSATSSTGSSSHGTVSTGSTREEGSNATDVLRELQGGQHSTGTTANTGSRGPIVNGQEEIPSWMQ